MKRSLFCPSVSTDKQKICTSCSAKTLCAKSRGTCVHTIGWRCWDSLLSKHCIVSNETILLLARRWMPATSCVQILRWGIKMFVGAWRPSVTQSVYVLHTSMATPGTNELVCVLPDTDMYSVCNMHTSTDVSGMSGYFCLLRHTNMWQYCNIFENTNVSGMSVHIKHHCFPGTCNCLR